jgi:predicted nuclease with TOPRIM domain
MAASTASITTCCAALKAAMSGEVLVVCVVPKADTETIAKVLKYDGVRLVSLGVAGSKLGVELAGETRTALQDHVPEMSDDKVWLGHDVITGEISKTLRERHGGRLALLHHMS